MNKVILLFVAFLAVECTKSQDIKGVWYVIDEDCTYNEIHINKSNLTICNSATGGCTFIYNYTLKQDSIYILDKNQLKNTIAYKFDNDDVLHLFSNNEWQTFNRLKEPIQDYFLIKDEEKEIIQKFEYELFLRGQKAKAAQKCSN